MDTQATQLRAAGAKERGFASAFVTALPFLALLLVGLSFPLFGGGEVFGVLGLILGPVIATLSLAVLKTYGEEVRREEASGAAT